MAKSIKLNDDKYVDAQGVHFNVPTNKITQNTPLMHLGRVSDIDSIGNGKDCIYTCEYNGSMVIFGFNSFFRTGDTINNHSVQLALSYLSPNISYRTRYNNAWTAWQNIS